MTRLIECEKGVVQLLIALVSILTMKIQKMMKITSQQTSVHPLTAVGSGRESALDSKHPMTTESFVLKTTAHFQYFSQLFGFTLNFTLNPT